MDIVDRLIGHDLWLTNRLLDRAAVLDPQALDKQVLKDAPLLFGSPPITTRDILNAMVSNKENWTASITGTAPPENGGTSVECMKRRLDSSGKQFQALVKDMSTKGTWDTGFVDALCDPPQSFTYGGMLAHVLTFSTYRRTLAILALRELGVDDLGIGDPAEWERTLA